MPFFAVLLCGMLAARLRLIDDAGLLGLNAFVFWFALPALLFGKVATTPFARLTDWTLYVGYEGSCVLLYLLVLAAARWGAGRSLQEAAICAFAASWGNVGYMGVPLLMAAYGEAAALPAVLAVVLDTLVLQSLTIFLLESGSTAGSWRQPARRRLGRDPQPADHRRRRRRRRSRAGPRPAGPGHRVLSAPRAGGGPGALFALGATLRGGAMVEDQRLVAGTIMAKLLLLPAVAWLVLQAVPLPAELWSPLIIATALPTAASVFVIAQRYGVLERQVAAIVFVSHLLGILTLTGLLVLLPG